MSRSVLTSKVFASASLLALSFALMSCQSVPEEPEPVSLQPVAQVVGPQPVDPSPVYRKKTGGGYPNFAGQLTAAGKQISDDEAQEMEAQLSGLGGRKGATSQRDYQRTVNELREISDGQTP